MEDFFPTIKTAQVYGTIKVFPKQFEQLVHFLALYEQRITIIVLMTNKTQQLYKKSSTR